MPSALLIAVIDDEDAVRTALRRLLRSEGMAVETLSGGAHLMWQVEASVGCNITRNIFTEVVYRALSFWYENDGLSFDTITHGPQITAGIRF